MGIRDWFSRKTKRIRCPDGSYREVYINPNDAFPLLASNFSLQGNAALSGLENIEAKVGAEFRQEISNLFLQIDSANKSMMSQFRAIYVVYSSNPCLNDDYLKSNIVEIIEKEQNMRRVNAEIHKISELLSCAPENATLELAFQETMRRLALPESVLAVEEALKDSANDVETWRE
jgi:hypothetical protein